MKKCLIREYKRITSHKGMLFLLFLWPLFYALVFASIYLNEVVAKMRVTLIDQDHSQLSRTFTRFIESSRSFSIKETTDDLNKAEDQILSGTRAVVIIIPRNFQKNIKKGKQTEITAWINSSNLIIAN